MVSNRAFNVPSPMMGFSTSSPSATSGGGQSNSPVRISYSHFIHLFSFSFDLVFHFLNVPLSSLSLRTCSAQAAVAPSKISISHNLLLSLSNFPNPPTSTTWRQWQLTTGKPHSLPAKTAPPRPLRSGDETKSVRFSAMPAACSLNSMVDLGR